MRLVETDSPHGDEEVAEAPRPPRPERRRVYVSLAVTLGVLVATVLAVYFAFPKRDNELLHAAVDAHRDGGPFELDHPSAAELSAWAVGVVGHKVPWPDRSGLEVIGTRRLEILRRPAALVRYRAGQDEVTLIVLRARDAPPRRYRRTEGEELVVSWRRGPWTFIVVGAEARADAWRVPFGAP